MVQHAGALQHRFFSSDVGAPASCDEPTVRDSGSTSSSSVGGGSRFVHKTQTAGVAIMTRP